MWVNPNHPNPPRNLSAPAEQGERLACFDRPKGERLVVTLEEFNGHSFVRCQVWAPGSDGVHWPVRGKCVTFKTRELAGLIEALGPVALGLPQDRRGATGGRPDPRSAERGPRRASGAPGTSPDPDPGSGGDAHPGRASPRTPCRGKPPAGSRKEFDEFS